MRTITASTELSQAQARNSLIMFGGADCSVCSAVKPKIETMLAEDFPRLESIYLDCQGEAATMCAQEGIFSIPVVQVWFEGRKYAEFVRIFSMIDLHKAIAKPYELTFHDEAAKPTTRRNQPS